MNKTYVCTDIHGMLDKFLDVLKQSKFDYDNDTLINIGDICDRGSDSFGVVEELLKIKNLIAIRGNHDWAWLEFIESGFENHPLPNHGAFECLESYRNNEDYLVNPCKENLVPKSHLTFYRGQLPYHIDGQNRLFIHAGLNLEERIEEQTEDVFCWDRSLIYKAMSCGHNDRLNDVNNFKQIFIGHTPTINWQKKGKNITKPIYKGQVVNLDTGACFAGGKMTLIDITTDKHKIYQS